MNSRHFFAALLLLPIAVTRTWAADGFAFDEKKGEHLDVLLGSRVVARYMIAHDTSSKERRAETYKPYLHVFDAKGEAPITKGPGGDFPHHRGIFLGWNKIQVGGKSFDRWHMTGGDQIHREFSNLRMGETAEFTSMVEWQGASAEAVLLKEARKFTFRTAPAPVYVSIEVESIVTAVAGDVVLGGDPEHAGLHFRPANELDRTQTQYLYPLAEAKPHKDVDYPWFALHYTLRGEKYGVAYLHHPKNPPGARISAYRDYGRFGAFWTKPLAKDESATFRVRFLISTAALSSATIQNAYNEFAGTNAPDPKTSWLAAERPAPKKPAATPAPPVAK